MFQSHGCGQVQNVRGRKRTSICGCVHESQPKLCSLLVSASTCNSTLASKGASTMQRLRLHCIDFTITDLCSGGNLCPLPSGANLITSLPLCCAHTSKEETEHFPTPPLEKSLGELT